MYIITQYYNESNPADPNGTRRGIFMLWGYHGNIKVPGDTENILVR